MAVLLLAACANGVATIYLLRHQDKEDNTVLTSLIINAIEDLNRPLVIEPTTGKAYIPSARLMLPPADATLGEVEYYYFPPAENAPAEVHLSSRNSVGPATSAVISASPDVEALFAAVPKLQACSRGVTINFAQQSDREAAANKLLASGKMAYFYTEKKCPNDKLLEYAKQIDSY